MKQIPLFSEERRLTKSHKCVLIGNTYSGYLSVISGDSDWLIHGGRYQDGWIKLMTIHTELNDSVARQAKLWAVRNFR